MAYGVQVDASGVRVKSTGVVVADTGTPCCCSGPYPCPGSPPSTLTIGLPTAVTAGSCAYSNFSCSPSITSTVATFGAGCSWLKTNIGCVAGKFNASPGHRVSLSNGVDGSNVPSWVVTVLIFGIVTGNLYIWYTTPRGGPTTNDQVGTYTLWKITSDAAGLVICVGATADATITVSP